MGETCLEMDAVHDELNIRIERPISGTIFRESLEVWFSSSGIIIQTSFKKLM